MDGGNISRHSQLESNWQGRSLLSQFNPPQPPIPTLQIHRFSRSSEVTHLSLFVSKSPICHAPVPISLSRSQVRMAQAPPAEPENNSSNSPDIKEPSPKIPKLHEDGVNGVSQFSTPLFRVKKLSEKAVLPSRASPLSAGYDLSSAAEIKVPARGKALIPTDLSIAIPQGTYARIAPRSGLAWKHSIDVGAGVIDADYRGPVGVILFNHSDVDFQVNVGDRVAQLIIEKIATPDVIEVLDLDNTLRGDGGFGSTGA